VGFISNQWLNRGQGLRNRKYSPVSVTVKAEVPTDSWSREHKVHVEFSASRSNAQYHTLHLTPEEVEPAANTMISACPSEMRARLVVVLLQELSDAQLLKVLAQDLKIRVKNAADR